MAKFVVFINIDSIYQNAPGGPDLSKIFRWSLRRFLGVTEGGGADPIENAGPEIATGNADTVVNAKGQAQAYASYYAQETSYVYDTDA